MPPTLAPPSETLDALAGPAAALARLAEGPDPEAWSWIVQHEGPAMFRTAARILGDAAAADDACQEAFLHVRTGARRFQPLEGRDPDASARAWLHRVASSAASMWSRTERRRAARERKAASEAIPPFRGTGDLDRLRQALATLPEDQRLPVVLHHLSGHDYATVGSALGISEGAARVRVHRAMERLRGHLSRVGMLLTVAGLLQRMAASEITMPAGSLGRWTGLLTSSATPAVSSTAIFGGLSLAVKLGLVGAVALLVGGLAGVGLGQAGANPKDLSVSGPAQPQAVVMVPTAGATTDERPLAGVAGDKAPDNKEASPVPAHGVAEGTVLMRDQKSLTLRTLEGDLEFQPHWLGGARGQHDPTMVAKLREYSVGDQVRIEWTWIERRRIDSISK